jgi:hypothetical protein
VSGALDELRKEMKLRGVQPSFLLPKLLTIYDINLVIDDFEKEHPGLVDLTGWDVHRDLDLETGARLLYAKECEATP